MSFQQNREKTKKWWAWVRQHGPTLTEHGLPPEAIETDLDWFLLLDHGYIQSTETAMADEMLSDARCGQKCWRSIAGT